LENTPNNHNLSWPLTFRATLATPAFIFKPLTEKDLKEIRRVSLRLWTAILLGSVIPIMVSPTFFILVTVILTLTGHLLDGPYLFACFAIDRVALWHKTRNP